MTRRLITQASGSSLTTSWTRWRPSRHTLTTQLRGTQPPRTLMTPSTHMQTPLAPAPIWKSRTSMHRTSAMASLPPPLSASTPPTPLPSSPHSTGIRSRATTTALPRLPCHSHRPRQALQLLQHPHRLLEKAKEKSCEAMQQYFFSFFSDNAQAAAAFILVLFYSCLRLCLV